MRLSCLALSLFELPAAAPTCKRLSDWNRLDMNGGGPGWKRNEKDLAFPLSNAHALTVINKSKHEDTSWPAPAKSWRYGYIACQALDARCLPGSTRADSLWFSCFFRLSPPCNTLYHVVRTDWNVTRNVQNQKAQTLRAVACLVLVLVKLVSTLQHAVSCCQNKLERHQNVQIQKA